MQINVFIIYMSIGSSDRINDYFFTLSYIFNIIDLLIFTFLKLLLFSYRFKLYLKQINKIIIINYVLFSKKVMAKSINALVFFE